MQMGFLMTFMLALALLTVLITSVSRNPLVIPSGLINSVLLLDACTHLQPYANESVNRTYFSWYRQTTQGNPPKIVKEIIRNDSSERLSLYGNGSLKVLIQLEDNNVFYCCEATSVLANGYLVRSEQQLHKIDVIVPAFIDYHTLQNETVDWGSTYVIWCFEGGTRVSLEYKVNGIVVKRKTFKIIEDTLIECRVSNSAGEESASAFITVTPDSKEHALANPWKRGDLCKSLSEVLVSSSPCYSILEAEVDSSGGDEFQLKSIHYARSRLDTDRQLESVFADWSDTDMNNTRCLLQVKRLFCLMIYSKCIHEQLEEEFEDDEENGNGDENEMFKQGEAERSVDSIVHELPVCRQHCKAVSVVFCAASSGHSSDYDHPLQAYFSASSSAMSMWLDLMQLAKKYPRILPTHEKGTEFCHPLVSVSNDLPTVEECYRLNFEQSSKTLNLANSSADCFVGTGDSFRGLDWAPTQCVPWDQVSPSEPISPLVFPASLETSANGNLVCRNPLSLAARPFCLAPRDSSSQLYPVECLRLHQCTDIDSTNTTNVRPLDKAVTVSSMLVSVYSLVVAFLLLTVLILFAYIYYVRPWHSRSRRSLSKLQHQKSADSDLDDALDGVPCQGDEHTAAALGRRRHTLIDRRRRLRETKGGAPIRLVLRCIFACHDGLCCTCWRSYALPQSQGQNMPTDTVDMIAVDDEDEEVEVLQGFMKSGGRGYKMSHLVDDLSATTTDVVTSNNAKHVFPELHLDSSFVMASIGQIIHPKLKKLAYPRKLLTEERVIAQSVFGRVILARTSGLSFECHLQHVPSNFVIVKTLEDDATAAAETSFIREAELLVDLKHPNIMKILGICVPLSPLSLICEYAPGGDLMTFLKTSIPPPSLTQLLTFSLDVCEACIFLSSKAYVHRDLATRNCLVDGRWRIKLADFSMCRRLPERGVDLIDVDGVGAPLAFRWLPLESLLEGIFQVDTDVWSFGVLLWEIFTYARQLPFGDCNITQVLQMLQDGERLDRPEDCPDQVYRIMRLCWSMARNRRPNFVQLKSMLQQIS